MIYSTKHALSTLLLDKRKCTDNYYVKQNQNVILFYMKLSLCDDTSTYLLYLYKFRNMFYRCSIKFAITNAIALAIYFYNDKKIEVAKKKRDDRSNLIRTKWGQLSVEKS